jgi:RNA exonuclease 1
MCVRLPIYKAYMESNVHSQSVISSIAALKQRPIPDSPAHPSVGTASELAARREAKAALTALTLTRAELAPLVLSRAALLRWGYMVDLPDGPGGTRTTEEGRPMRCERCGGQFEVKRAGEAAECSYHHGKPRTIKVNGARARYESAELMR